MDISPETASTLSQIMLAQAQEVFCIKATSGKPSSSSNHSANEVLHTTGMAVVPTAHGSSESE